MRKVNIYIIIRDHMCTLVDDRSGKISVPDIIFFYGLPTALAVGYYFFPFSIPDGLMSALIAVFSVFGALLFSAQMALFSLSPRAPHQTGDSTTDSRDHARYIREKKFFSDVNFNVSYLILLSCLFLTSFVVLMLTNWRDNVEGAILVAMISHFFLTLLMLIKRTHVAFSSKYSD
ncbi:hypothetical protein ACT6QH_01815 [Xanthobacter sp. TB0139]